MAGGRGRATKKRHSGRVTLTPCELLDDDRTCEPLNRVWLLAADGTVARKYASCTCGRRFSGRDVSMKLPEAAVEHLAARAEGRTGAEPLDAEQVAAVVAGLWPVERTSEWAKTGVVPVGQSVLHQPTAPVAIDAPAVADLAERLLFTQEDAHGIGLAANQVGAPVRALAHNLPQVAPTVLVNPVLLASHDEWIYEEGCLSLEIKGTWAKVRRPKVILVHAQLPDGTELVTEADELFSRVLQHELDHLDGVEYVQRLTGTERDRVYQLMQRTGVDTDWLPPLPYEWAITGKVNS
ncbi:peptide deformylase [Aquihabitans sp. G128]|uniref:peptide deformylase n=1 Tax=Aquihabitans sp. G128 TaxID=2849779 RepID=UPI001C24CDAD|nr:peptide deformylase [Aquihabitans sp. G128]QXC59423.1 peptide deformylase [Aquihabitans sp. G128]